MEQNTNPQEIEVLGSESDSDTVQTKQDEGFDFSIFNKLASEISESDVDVKDVERVYNALNENSDKEEELDNFLSSIDKEGDGSKESGAVKKVIKFWLEDDSFRHCIELSFSQMTGISFGEFIKKCLTIIE